MAEQAHAETVHGVLHVLACLVQCSTDGRRLSYREFACARRAMPAHLCSHHHLSSTLFAQLPRDGGDTVSLQCLARYLVVRLILGCVRARLAAYDSAGDGALREHDLENYIFDNIHSVPQLAALQENFYPFYVFTAVRRFFFFLDPNRVGRIAIRDLLGSRVFHDWLTVLPQSHPDTSPALELDRAAAEEHLVRACGVPPPFAEAAGALACGVSWEPPSPANWFTSSSALRVYSTYLQLDADQNGMLSPQEFAAFRGGAMTSAFTSRVFEECHTYGGEMDYKAYLDVTLATGGGGGRGTAHAIKFMFRLLDVQHAGYIGLFELKLFFRDVCARLPSLGHEGVDPGNVCDEIMDMVAPKVAGRITVEDLRRCKVGHIVCAILTDALAFIAYDRREESMTTSGDGGGEGSGTASP